jgi:hypothetical protein
MMQYDPQEVFRALDSIDVRVLIGLALASAGYYVQYIANVRTGFRDRKHATPVAANMWNFADDLTYVLMFDRWFNDERYSHWFTHVMWFGLLAWVVMETITHYQTIKYSLADLFPGLSRPLALGLYVGCQLSLLAVFAFLVATLDDPLWLVMFATTQFTSVAFYIPMLLSRRNTRGISTVSASALVVAPPAFIFLFLPAVAPGFNRWPTYAFGIACTGIAVAYYFLLAGYRRRNAESHLLVSAP